MKLDWACDEIHDVMTEVGLGFYCHIVPMDGWYIVARLCDGPAVHPQLCTQGRLSVEDAPSASVAPPGTPGSRSRQSLGNLENCTHRPVKIEFVEIALT
jgi:hypothetical protein